jgi:hypothetical protein
MSIDPKILKRMQGEDTFLQSQTRGSRRVKLERGHNWIVRFLPAQMGPDGLWFARIARHWFNKLPIICTRNTAEDFGGNPEAPCPVCVLADELNDSSDEVISKFGYKAKANPQFLTYCIVWEKDGIQQPMSEVIVPYEFWHYRNTWEELKGFYVAGGRKSPNSVLDYELGNDFSVNKTAKGVRLDKQDSSPIFDSADGHYAEWIKKLEAAMKTPKVTIPTLEQLEVFAQKLQEAANRGGVPEDEDAPRRRRPTEDDDEAQFRRGARRAAPAAAEEPEDDLPYDAPPARPAARAAAPARRSAPEPEAAEAASEDAPRRRSAPVDQEELPPARRPEAAPRRPAPVAEEDEVPVRRPAPAAPARRPAPPAQESEPEPEPTEAEPERPAAVLPVTQRRTLAPTTRRAAAAVESAGSAPQGEPEDEDPLPEDDTDPAPPAPKAGEEDVPPPVARRGSQGSDIKSRLAKLPRGA